MRAQEEQALVERLDWRIASRDDAAVAQALASGAEVEEVYALEAGALLDGFWAFLGEVGVQDLLAGVTVAARARVIVPTIQVLLTYHLKILMGIASINALPALLFSDQAAMRQLGFNAALLTAGLTRRSADRRGPAQAPPRPMCPEVIGDLVGALSAAEASAYFNGVIARLAAWGAFGPAVRGVMDGTVLRVPPTVRGRTLGARGEGYKLLALLDAHTGLPLALLLVAEHAAESDYVLTLLGQAQANLGSASRLSEFVADRAYVDGPVLAEVDDLGIIFTVVLKDGMCMREDARALVAAGEGYRGQRPVTVRHGSGRTAWTEERITEVVGIAGLTSYDDYNSRAALRHKGRRRYCPRPLNAVVVTRWDGRTAEAHGHYVFATNGSVRAPLATFDRYDDRSLIENLLFREGKQPWQLQRAPQRTEAAIWAHICLTLATAALATAYRAWAERQDRLAEQAEQAQRAVPTRPEEGFRHWRARLFAENRDLVLLFLDLGPHTVYGILHLAELAVLSGVRLRKLPPHLGSRADIFARYGLSPPA